MNDFVDILGDPTPIRLALSHTIQTVCASAVLFSAMAGDSSEMVSDRGAAAIQRNQVTMVTRPMNPKPVFSVMTRTEYGYATVGEIIVDAQGTDVVAPFTTTLPPSLFTVDEVRINHNEGRVLISVTTHGCDVTATDLTSPSTALGRLIRFSVIQKVFDANHSSVNFDARSSRIVALANRLGVTQP